MPSPTSRTRPTSRVSAPVLRSLISRVRTETISSGLNRMAATLDELVPQGFQLRADGGVVQPVAHPHHQAADQVGVHFRREDRLAPEARAQFVAQPLELLLRQRRGRAHLDGDLAGPLLEQIL